MTHLQTLAEQIAARNVARVFGIPGSGPSLELLDALERSGVRFHLTHFEGSAALMAGAVGKLSGQSAVAVAIKGPGLANMLPGLAACRLDAFPVVSIAEAYLPEVPRRITHKRLDHGRLLAAVVKGHYFLTADGPGFDALASLAESEVPGPVHLDVAAKPAGAQLRAPKGAAAPKKDKAWPAAEALLAQSTRPLVIAGSLAVRRSLSDRLNALNVPVFSTSAAKGVVDERLPHAAGVYTGVGGPRTPEAALMPAADLVVGIGLRHNEVLAVGPFDCPAIGIDPVGASQASGFKFQSVIGGTAAQVATVWERLADVSWGLDRLRAVKNALRRHMLAEGFLPAHVYDGMAAHFAEGARLVLDTGNFCTIGEHAWEVSTPGRYLASGQGRYMGVGLPLAVGAALYDPTLPTLLFTGDGGIGMFLAEIKLAVQHKLPLIVVLMTDGHLGTIRGGALQKGLSEGPAVIAQPSWLDALAGLGVPGVRIGSAAALEDALAHWTMQSGPLYLEAAFDPDAYQRMTAGIR